MMEDSLPGSGVASIQSASPPLRISPPMKRVASLRWNDSSVTTRRRTSTDLDLVMPTELIRAAKASAPAGGSSKSAWDGPFGPESAVTHVPTMSVVGRTSSSAAVRSFVTVAVRAAHPASSGTPRLFPTETASSASLSRSEAAVTPFRSRSADSLRAAPAEYLDLSPGRF